MSTGRLLLRSSSDREGDHRRGKADTPATDAMRRYRSRTARADVDQTSRGLELKQATFETDHHWPGYVLQNRDTTARLLRLFASPRKRLGLTSDELLIFFAIGYLCTTVTDGAVQVSPIALVDVSAFLGIPKETVRRKTVRLVDLDYVSCTTKGVLIKQVRIWCEMLDRAFA